MTQAIDSPGHDPTTPDGDVNPIDTDYTAGQDNIVMNLGPFGLDIHNKVFAISALLIIVFVALTMTFQTQAEPIEMPMIDTTELEARLYRNQPYPVGGTAGITIKPSNPSPFVWLIVERAMACPFTNPTKRLPMLWLPPSYYKRKWHIDIVHTAHWIIFGVRPFQID